MKIKFRRDAFILFVFFILIALGYLFYPHNYNNDENQTTIIVSRNSLNVGKSDIHTLVQANYQIKNTGKNLLLIQAVHTSCGCTTAKYDEQPVASGGTATVVLEYKPTEAGYFRKTADVVCNVPAGFVRLTIAGEVLKK